MVQPRKLVAPVSDKVQYTHQAKSRHTLTVRQRK